MKREDQASYHSLPVLLNATSANHTESLMEWTSIFMSHPLFTPRLQEPYILHTSYTVECSRIHLEIIISTDSLKMT